MKKIKKILHEIFIEGLGGMAVGLFATLIIGTIIIQVGTFVPDPVGNYLILIGKLASSLTGAGIGCGVATRLKGTPLVVVSAIVVGQIGAFAGKLIAGTVFVDGIIQLKGPGEPLGAFIAALVAIYIGKIVSGRTKVDILITPFLCIVTGSAVGLFVGPPISEFMLWLGSIINWGTDQAPFIMGIIVSVFMGMFLTLPISSAAISIILGLSGAAAGAATVGCCANMIGFAIISFQDNKVNGLLAQGLGTSMLQIGNIVKKPIIFLPAIISSAILGPLATIVFKMTNNATGAGMGTAGLVGQITTYQTMIQTEEAWSVLTKIGLLHFLFPALLAWLVVRFLRKKNLIKKGDMTLTISN